MDLYLDCCSNTKYYLLNGDGPLPFDQRQYIAIMASATHSCTCLVKFHTAEFLSCGGNKLWLNSHESIPQKLQNLKEINEILSRNPWLLTKEHTSKLLSAPGTWSLSELTQAIVILTYVHSMSSFVSAFDAMRLQTSCDILTCRLSSTANNSSSSVSSSSVFSSFVPISSSEESFSDDSELEMTDLCRTHVTMFTGISVMNYSWFLCNNYRSSLQYRDTKNSSTDILSPSSLEILNFLDDSKCTYQEFRERKMTMTTKMMRASSAYAAHDYSWLDHGYSLVNRLYTDIGIYLDEEFTAVQNLSSAISSSGEDRIDSVLFSNAIWNYVVILFGIQLDDYDHNMVNQMLSSQTKAYTKLVACFPERLNHPAFRQIFQDFNQCDMLYLNMIIREARFQVELLYCLRSLSKS